jgi:hypothetical protein
MRHAGGHMTLNGSVSQPSNALQIHFTSTARFTSLERTEYHARVNQSLITTVNHIFQHSLQMKSPQSCVADTAFFGMITRLTLIEKTIP